MSYQPPRSAFCDAAPLTYAPAKRDADALVRQYLPLVKKLAWHVHGSMSTLIDVEDLIQVGLVALVEASAQAPQDSVAHGGQFRAYLVTRVRGSMIDELRRQATTTRGAMRRRRAYTKAIATLTQQLGHAPGEAMIAAQLGVSIDKLRADYLTAEAIAFEPIDEAYADDLPWFADDGPNAFDQLADGEQRDRLVAAIAGLPEREAMVVQLYYVEELNLEEIGQVLGVGAARVCQLKSAAHGRLRKALAGVK